MRLGCLYRNLIACLQRDVTLAGNRAALQRQPTTGLKLYALLPAEVADLCAAAIARPFAVTAAQPGAEAFGFR
ncbi:hypothetical protein D3C81_946040 [compost metagenome]